MLELQAPQGPYTNVLDLQVFPAMSKRHSELLQVFSNTEADKDRIWKIAMEIWNTMTSSMVARAFLLAYRIMGKIVETKGDTDWLKNGASYPPNNSVTGFFSRPYRSFSKNALLSPTLYRDHHF